MTITSVPQLGLYVTSYKGKQLVARSMQEACENITALFDIVHFNESEQIKGVKRYYQTINQKK